MLITVNGVEISDAAIVTEMPHHPAPSQDIARYSATLALIAKELLLQEAARLGIADEDEDDRITALFEREVQTPEPDEAACQRFFAANRERIRGGDLFETSHIQLHRKTEGQPLTYDMARDRIASYLREQGQRHAVSQYLSRLTGRADIQGIDLLGATSSLAQQGARK